MINYYHMLIQIINKPSILLEHIDIYFILKLVCLAPKERENSFRELEDFQFIKQDKNILNMYNKSLK